MKKVIQTKWSIKLDGETKLTEEVGKKVLDEFARKKYRFSPFFKIKNVEVKYIEYFQVGHMDIDFVWRFWFSRFFFELLGGHIEYD